MALVKFLTKFACAGGTVIAVVPQFESGTMGRNLDNSERLTLVVPINAPYLAQIGINTCVSVTDDLGNTYEWLISQIDDGRHAGDGITATITAEPAIMFLADCGIIYDTYATSDAVVYNNGLNNATPYQYLSTYLMPWFAAKGYSWISIGTVDFSSRCSVGWNRWTPLQILQEVASKTQNELAFRRNGTTGYYIDIVTTRNGSLSSRLLRTDRNVIWLTRTRRKDPIKNTVVPAGMVAAGEIESATMAMTAMKLTAVGAGSVDVADPTSSENLIQYDDQLTGYYVLKPDATLTLITGCTVVNQRLTLASVAGLAIGDHIEIRRDSNGAHLTELKNPAAVTQYGGVVGGTVEDTTLRGERNHVPNPVFTTWSRTSPGDVLLGAMVTNTATSPTTINGLTNGLVIAVGDAVVCTGRIRYVTVGGTVAAGSVTVTLNTAMDGGLAGQPVYIWRLQTMPTNWQRPEARTLFNRYDATLSGSMSCAANGTQAAVRSLALKSLAVGTVIQPGDHVVTAGGARFLVLSGATADGSGNATVVIGAIISVTNGDALTIIRAALPAKQANAVLLAPYGNLFTGGGALSPAFRTPSYKIRANTQTPSVWCSFFYSIHAIGAAALTAASTDYSKAKLEIYNVDTSTVVATITEADMTLAAGGVYHGVLRQAIQLTASTTLALIFYPPTPKGTGSVIDYATFTAMARGAMIHIGADPAVPIVDGSHGNALWRLGNDTLYVQSFEQRTLKCLYADLARLNPDLATETLDVGQYVRLMTDSMAGDTTLDVTVRVTSVLWDLLDPMNSQLTLDTVDPRVTRMLGKASTKKLYVNVDILLDSNGKVVDPSTGTSSAATTVSQSLPTTGGAGAGAGGGSTNQAGSDAPPDQTGARRGGVPTSQTPNDDGITPLPPTKYYKIFQ